MDYDHFNYCQRFLWLMLKAMPTGEGRYAGRCMGSYRYSSY